METPSRMVFSTPLTTVGTTAVCAPGTIRQDTDSAGGTREWIYIKNDSGSTIAAYKGTMFKSGSVSYGSVTVSGSGCPRPRFAGVAQWDIADQSYAWVLRRGMGTVLASAAGIAANADLKAAASGEFEAGTMGAQDLLGHIGAAIAASSTGSAYIAG